MRLTKSHSSLNESIRSGDILFFEGAAFAKDPLVYLIKVITRSEITHVAIAYWIKTELFVIESQYGKDRVLTHIDNFMGRNVIAIKPPYIWGQIEDSVISTIPKVDYSITDLIAVGFANLLLAFGIKVQMPNFRGEICSEFVAKLCKIDPPNISPKQLFDILKKGR